MSVQNQEPLESEGCWQKESKMILLLRSERKTKRKRLSKTVASVVVSSANDPAFT